jgi:peptidoglycan/xylan/chitin deacetylase (PgdA/CDA1 family)
LAAGEIVSGELGKNWLRIPGVPVFAYHAVDESEKFAVPSRERKYRIHRTQFKEHLQQIAQFGYETRLLSELWNCRDLTGAGVVTITFDDGLLSAYEVAYPLLLEMGMRAEFFVNTATLDTTGFLTSSQLCEMHRAGMSFQSHSHEHLYLTWLSTQRLEHQLSVSKRLLEDRLGCPVDFLAPPYGDVSPSVLEAAWKAGYQGVCTSRSWPAKPGARTVSRTAVYGHTTPPRFRRLLVGDALAYRVRRVRESLAYLPKRLLLPFWPSPAPVGT